MTRTAALLKCYLEENSTLSPDKIDDLIPKRSFNSDIEVDCDVRPTSSNTKELAGKMRNIADDYNSKWDKPRRKIVSDITNAPNAGSLTSMLNTFFQENQLMSCDDKKAAFTLKCLADIAIKGSTYLKDFTEEAYDLIDGYSL